MKALVVVPDAGRLLRLVVDRHVRHVGPFHNVLEYIFATLLGTNELHVDVAVEDQAEKLTVSDDVLVREDYGGAARELLLKGVAALLWRKADVVGGTVSVDDSAGAVRLGEVLLTAGDSTRVSLGLGEWQTAIGSRS